MILALNSKGRRSQGPQLHGSAAPSGGSHLRLSAVTSPIAILLLIGICLHTRSRTQHQGSPHDTRCVGPDAEGNSRTTYLIKPWRKTQNGSIRPPENVRVDRSDGLREIRRAFGKSRDDGLAHSVQAFACGGRDRNVFVEFRNAFVLLDERKQLALFLHAVDFVGQQKDGRRQVVSTDTASASSAEKGIEASATNSRRSRSCSAVRTVSIMRLLNRVSDL